MHSLPMQVPYKQGRKSWRWTRRSISAMEAVGSLSLDRPAVIQWYRIWSNEMVLYCALKVTVELAGGVWLGA